jgi:hypothetical protein
VKSIKRWFKVSKGEAKSYSASWESKKAIFKKSLKLSLSRRMVLITHNLNPGHLKQRLWWSRWSDVPKCQRAMRNHFVKLGYCKKRLGRSRLNDVLSRRMAWRTHYLSPGRLKKRLWWRRWRDVSRCQKAMRNNFLHSAHRAIFTKSFKWCFKLMKGPENS